jgi:hypothetical protein
MHDSFATQLISTDREIHEIHEIQRIFPGNRFPPHVRPAQLANLNAKITAETPDEER